MRFEGLVLKKCYFQGEFLQKGFNEGTELLEKFNNLGAHAVHGHQEATGGYQQNKGILPIH